MSIDEKINNADQTPLHSHSYAEAASTNGSMVGDVGLSLEQRELLESKRRYVENYGRSALGAGYIPREMRHYRAGERSGIKVGQRSTRQSMNAADSRVVVPKRQIGKSTGTGFQEPPTRSYNPYA